MAAPMVLAVYYSLTDWQVGQDETWTGLANYTRLLSDPEFHTAVLSSLGIVAWKVASGEVRNEAIIEAFKAGAEWSSKNGADHYSQLDYDAGFYAIESLSRELSDYAATVGRLSAPRGGQSGSTFLRKAAGLSPVGIALLREGTGNRLRVLIVVERRGARLRHQMLEQAGRGVQIGLQVVLEPIVVARGGRGG